MTASSHCGWSLLTTCHCLADAIIQPRLHRLTSIVHVLHTHVHTYPQTPPNTPQGGKKAYFNTLAYTCTYTHTSILNISHTCTEILTNVDIHEQDSAFWLKGIGWCTMCNMDVCVYVYVYARGFEVKLKLVPLLGRYWGVF